MVGNYWPLDRIGDDLAVGMIRWEFFKAGSGVKDQKIGVEAIGSGVYQPPPPFMLPAITVNM
jgi:hypothetical protein